MPAIRPLPALLSILVAVALLASAAPARGADREIAYLALGDSVASGAGVGEAVSYPRLLGERIASETGQPVRYLNRAREGEQSAGVIAHQLDALAEFRPDLVTLTVGANDFLVPTWECIASSLDATPGAVCNVPDPRASMASLEANLREIVRRITRETSATIAVTTYYNPFPRGTQCGSIVVDAAMRQLNVSIAGAVSQAPDRAVVVDLMPIFRGHEGEEPAGWFAGGPLGISCAAIHPNARGQAAIAAALWDALAGRLAS